MDATLACCSYYDLEKDWIFIVFLFVLILYSAQNVNKPLDTDHALALNILTWIGCVASIVCLAATVFILTYFK